MFLLFLLLKQHTQGLENMVFDCYNFPRIDKSREIELNQLHLVYWI